MKVNILFSLFALRAVAETNLAPRDSATISKLLNDIFFAMQNADTQLLAYHGGLPFAFRQAAEELFFTISSSTPISASMERLTAEDVQAIGEISHKVTATGTKFLEDLIQAVPIFEKTGLCEHLFQYSVWLGKVSDEFFVTTKSKFPEEHQVMAQQEITSTEELFARLQAALAPGVCVSSAEGPKFCNEEPWKDHGDENKGDGDSGNENEGEGDDGGENEGEGDEGNGDSGNASPSTSAENPAPTGAGNNQNPHKGNDNPPKASGTHALRHSVSALVLLMGTALVL